MRIKQRLRINALVAVLTVIAVLAVLLVGVYRVIATLQAMEIADAVITTSFERFLLRTDYTLTGSERAREQWSSKDDQIGTLLKSASEKFTDPEDKKTVDALLKARESVGKIFQIVVENRKTGAAQGRPAALTREVEERLLNQLNIRIYETVLLGGKLQDAANTALLTTVTRAGGGILLILIFVGAGTVLNSWVMSRAIAHRAGLLRAGAEVIGAGNLDYKIDVKGNDELAELAAAFNGMSAKLGGSYRDLEGEVAVRKRAEEALASARDELELRVKERTEELTAAEAELKEANEKLERRVVERTAELTAANEALRASRAAALNLMDDAVSARKKAEEAGEELQREIAERRRAEADLDRAQEVGQIGSWRLDVRKNVLTWSDENHRIFGVSKGTPLTYETFLGICHPDDRSYVDARWKAGLRGEPYDLEHRIVADGRVKWVREKAYLEFDGTGQLVGGFGISQDITDRKRAEEEIRSNLDNLRKVNEELARFNRAAVGRELRMIELKGEVNTLSARLGQPPPYPPQSSPLSGT